MYFTKFIDFIGNCGLLETDQPSQKLNKRILSTSSFFISIAGVLWGSVYYFLSFFEAAIFPLLYSIIVGITLIWFCKYKSFTVFVNIQLLLMLLLPFSLQFALGGFSNSGAVMVWAILAPFGSLVFQNKKNALFWLIGYISLAILLTIYELNFPSLPISNSLKLLFFSMNIITVSLFSFFIMLYFVDESKKEFIKQTIIERQREALETTNKIAMSYARFIPSEFLSFLNKPFITDLQLGDCIEDNLTIFFSDIRGYTTFSEKLSAKDVLLFLNSYLSVVSPIIKSNFGFIDKFIGDAIMAIFPRSPLNALIAAIAMCKKLESYNIMREEKFRETIRIGIGMHTGKMALGVVGSNERMDTTVIGDSVNLASRLESLTKIFFVPILISESFYNHLPIENREEIREIDIVKVKGKTDAIKVYEVFSADTKEVIKKKKNTKQELMNAINLFREGNVLESRKQFVKCQIACPEDSIPVVYINRCDEILSEGTNTISKLLIKEKILVVDDNIAVLEYTQFLLKKAKFEVIIARNGKEAILKYGEFTPEYIIMDFSMPDLNGIQVAEIIQGFAKLKNVTPEIIFVTSKNSIDIKNEILKLGYSYLPKPINITDFLNLIRIGKT